MTLYSWVKKREQGLKCKIGDQDNLYKKIYKSFEPKNCWNDTEGTSDFGGVFNLEFSLDGSLLAAACEKKSIVLFDPMTALPIKTIFNAHQDCVNGVKFLDDRLFASCSDDSTVALWDIRNLKTKIKSLHGHSNWVKNIEYSKKDCLLVTSGFDGSIFTWDINSSTESGFIYQKVFHTAGLMRCRITPDANRMVICTTGGYLIIIHNLDLSTLGRDLNGFRPNVYRLMQMGRQFIPYAANFEHIFSKSQKKNRVELISDFPERNDAEVVSSLQIHPQGWCALSRNISYDESSEWTCIHDIQEMEIKEDDVSEENVEIKTQSNNSNLIFNEMIINENENDENLTGSNNRPNNRPYNVLLRLSNGLRQRDATVVRNHPDIWAAEVSVRDRTNNTPTAFDASHVYGITSGVIRSSTVQTTPSNNTNQQDELSSSNVDIPPNIIQDDISSTEHSYFYKPRHITQNAKRMLFFKEEPNKGKGFIKELCFSADGRIICSPYGFGIRLLTFSKDCSELPVNLHPENKPQEMHEIKMKKCHSDIVVSTKFSPKHPLLVSGCLRGKVVWHYPVL